MRNLKRVLSLALALVMVLGMMVITTSAADFTDADEITNIEAVEVMTTLGILEGNPDGSFNPNGTLTRAQAAKLICYMLGYGETAEKLSGAGLFTDVGVGMSNWAAGYIAFCASRGYIAGNGDGTFNPAGELTDIALGKMVLCALGADAEEEGYVNNSNWASNVSVDMLDNGLVEEVTGEAISREDACAMILNAMKVSDVAYVYACVIDDVYYTFETESSAMAYFAALQDGINDEWIGLDYVYTGSLLDTVYDVTVGRVPDAFGRPGTSYDLNDAAGTVLKYTKRFVATFTTEMSEKDLYAALGASGITGAYSKYVVMDQVWVDGVRVATASQIGTTGQYQATSANEYANTVVIAKGDRSNIAGMGNGTVTEIYRVKANHYIMVCTNEHIGTVSSVTAANAVTEADRYITIAGMNYTTEDFAARDVVLYTVANGKIMTVKAAEAVSGKVTKITNGSVYTIDGTDYVVSNRHANPTLSLSAAGSWYVDSCGNIIKDKSAARATTYYGYALEVGQVPYQAGTLTQKGKDTYEAVKFVNADGEVEVLETAWTQTYTNGVISGQNFVASSLSAGHLFAYTLNADGKIASVSLCTQAPNAGATVAKNTAEIGSFGKYGTDKTVYFLTDGTETVAYVGYTNVPTKTGTVKEWFFVNDSTKDNYLSVNAIVLQVSDVEASTAAQYAYIATGAKTAETTAAGTIYTYTNVYVDGVKTSLQFKGTDPAPTVGGVYTVTFNTADGMAALSASPVFSSTGSNAEITAIQTGYFKTAGGIVYTDKDTVYYEIDMVNKTITAVEGLTALSNNGAYSVNLMNNDKGTAANNAADVVFFYVGA